MIAALAVVKQAGHRVVYIDCGGSLDEARLHKLVSSGHYGSDIETVLQRIQCIKVFTVWDLISVIENIKQKITENV